MSRQVRSFEPGKAYHLISRFVAKEFFLEGERDRARYLRCFGEHVLESDWRFFAFATMSSHLHFGAVAGKDPIATIFRPVHTTFAEAINRNHDRIGAVFARGPKSRDVAEGGIARVIGYIHCNPVRAGIVDDPSQSTWTSHRAYLGLDAAPKWLDMKLGLDLAGFHDATDLADWISETLRRGELQMAHLEGEPRCGRPKQWVLPAPTAPVTAMQAAW